MRILDRYISNSIITIFVATIFIFLFLYVVIDVMTQLDEFIDRKIPIQILLDYYIHFFPIILVQISSIACLIATLFTFSGLSNNNEIIAMRTSGLNFWQIARPAILFGLFISILVFWLNERYVPYASLVTKKIRDENMMLAVDYAKKKLENITNLTFYGLKNRLYFVDSYNPNDQELNNITIIEHDGDQIIKQKIVAFKGKWTGVVWKFYNCQTTIFENGNFENLASLKFDPEKLMDIEETPDDFMKQRIHVDTMNMKDLSDYIERFSKSGAMRAINNLRVDLYYKLAYPFQNFVIILIGLPFALMLKSRKGMTFASLGIAVGIGFLYYVTQAVSLALGKGGLFPPLISAWMAPFLFSSAALIMIQRNF